MLAQPDRRVGIAGQERSRPFAVVTNLTPFGASVRKDADLRSVDAFVSPNDRSSAGSSQPDSLRETTSLTTFENSSEEGRGRWEYGVGEAIRPKSMDSFVVALQRAPLSKSSQRSESAADHDGVTAEAVVFSPVQPPVQEIEPDDVDNLKILFDQLLLSSSKGKES
jgi:hypothetical protein